MVRMHLLMPRFSVSPTIAFSCYDTTKCLKRVTHVRSLPKNKTIWRFFTFRTRSRLAAYQETSILLPLPSFRIGR